MGLELRVAHLEELVARLTLEVRVLQEAARGRSEVSEASFIPVSEPAAEQAAPPASAFSQPAQAPATPPRRPASGYTVPPSPTPSAASTVASPSQRQISAAQRAAACREIGLFLRRCQAGEHRGASGRVRIPLPSRLWLVLRNFEGSDLTPCVVCSRWAVCPDCQAGLRAWRLHLNWPAGPAGRFSRC